jgi:hypothetical protein
MNADQLYRALAALTPAERRALSVRDVYWVAQAILPTPK